MKKRILSILLISLALVGTVTTTKSNVKADSFNYYSTGKGFTHLKHKVVLIKPITIRKVHFYGHTFYTYLKEKKTLPAGTQIKILPYGDKGYYWLVFYGNKDTTRWVYPQKKLIGLIHMQNTFISTMVYFMVLRNELKSRIHSLGNSTAS